ncbi:hypothetical protein O4H61_03405 [Roseovarius aestuarii]|nr:hypothetical protein [Roseovarius aestuarii]
MDLYRLLMNVALQVFIAVSVAGTFVMQWQARKPAKPTFEIRRWPAHEAEGWDEMEITVRNPARTPLKITGITAPRWHKARFLTHDDCEIDDGYGNVTGSPRDATATPRSRITLQEIIPPCGATRFSAATGTEGDDAKRTLSLFMTAAKPRQPIILHWRWLDKDTTGRAKVLAD